MTEPTPDKVERQYSSLHEALSAAIEARVEPIEYKALIRGTLDTQWLTVDHPDDFLDELEARGFNTENKDSITLRLPLGHDTLAS